MKTESLLEYVDGLLATPAHPDYPQAFNGLQVAGPSEVRVIATAVDASLAAIERASGAGADLLMVHHGLFWDGAAPITGRRYRRVRALIESGIGLYGSHLPLDSHATLGNCVLLLRALDVEPKGRIGSYQGTDLGWWGELATPVTPDQLENALSAVLGGPVQSLPGGPDQIQSVGVVTGAGGSFIGEAAAMGLDAFVTGEAAHHHYFDADEFGIHVLLGGHYRTETLGIHALGDHLAERFSLTSHFLELPTGL